MTEFLDYFALQPLAILRGFKAAGAQGVVPYLDPFNPKGVTRAALADIYAAGLEIPGFFFETTGGAGQGASYFTRAQGVADCMAAEALLAQLAELAPPSARVWYAADVNIEPSAFDEYANGIESAATPRQTPGIYGYQRLMEHAFEHYRQMGRHLAQTYGSPTVPLELWQHEQTVIAGVVVDLDEVSVPGWKPQEDDMDQAAFDKMASDWWTRPAAAGGAEGLQTIEAIKTAIANDEAKIKVLDSETATVPDALAARVIQRVGQILFLRPPDKPAGVPPTAAWFDESDDLSTNGWTYPDGVIHFWRNGVELVPAPTSS